MNAYHPSMVAPSLHPFRYSNPSKAPKGLSLGRRESYPQSASGQTPLPIAPKPNGDFSSSVKAGHAPSPQIVGLQDSLQDTSHSQARYNNNKANPGVNTHFQGHTDHSPVSGAPRKPKPAVESDALVKQESTGDFEIQSCSPLRAGFSDWSRGPSCVFSSLPIPLYISNLFVAKQQRRLNKVMLQGNGNRIPLLLSGKRPQPRVKLHLPFEWKIRWTLRLCSHSHPFTLRLFIPAT